MILFNNWVMNEWVSSISCDNAGTARQIVNLLAGKDARWFAYVAGVSQEG